MVCFPNTCLNQKIPHYAKSLFEENKLNGKKDEFSFIAAGHIYGSHCSVQRGRLLPAATLLNNISLLKSLKSDFFVYHLVIVIGGQSSNISTPLFHLL